MVFENVTAFELHLHLDDEEDEDEESSRVPIEDGEESRRASSERGTPLVFVGGMIVVSLVVSLGLSLLVRRFRSRDDE